MHSQRALFTEMEQKPPEVEPPGFRQREQIVSEEEEAALATGLEKLGLKPFEFHGFLGNRRVINFGLKYDFSRRSVKRAPFDRWGSMNIILARELDGIKINRNLESSLVCHYWRLQRCAFGKRKVKTG